MIQKGEVEGAERKTALWSIDHRIATDVFVERGVHEVFSTNGGEVLTPGASIVAEEQKERL